jgi:hypothetical protein
MIDVQNESGGVETAGTAKRVLRFLRSESFKRLLLVLLVFAMVCYFRRDRMLTFNVANPDEAELLASGRRAAQSLVPYERFTSPTYGPAWALLLGLLGRLGFPLSLPLAHVLSALLAATTCALTAYVASRLRGLRFALFSIAPLAVYWGFGFNHQDYWSLSTELLPMTILVAGCAVASLGWSSNRLILFGAALVGFGAWSKYLFGLVGFAVLLALTFRLCRRGVPWYRAISGVVIASNSIMMLMYLLALLKGVPIRSVLESIQMTVDYIRGGGAGGMGDIPSVPLTSRLAAVGSSLPAFFPLLPLAVHSFRDASLKFSPVKGNGRYVVKGTQLSGIAIIISGLLTLCANPIVFPHYNYILVACCLAAFILSLPTDQNTESVGVEGQDAPNNPRVDRSNIAVLVVVLLMVAPVIRGVTWQEPRIKVGQVLDAEKNRWERAFDESDDPLSAECPPGSYVFVWGWSPEVYAFYDWRPASRFVAPAGMIDSNNLNLEVGPLRKKLTRELLVEPPDCVVDAIGPSFFPGYGPEASMKEQMPELWRSLAQNNIEKTYYWDRVNPILVIVRSKTDPISLSVAP